MTLDRFSLCSAGYLVSTHNGPWVKHDDAQARITQLEAERDAARAAGYAAGVRAAAEKITASIALLQNLGMTEGAEAIKAAASDICALLTQPVTTPE